MTRSVDAATEATLLTQYVETLPSPRASTEQERLRRMCQAFRAVSPGDSCLDRTHTTAWIPAWALRVSSPAARVGQIQALGRWWSWLFERGVLDDNVLAGFFPSSQVLRERTPVVLSHNLQRLIALYLDERGPRTRETRRRLRRRLEHFNLFLHRPAPRWEGQSIDEAVVLQWLHTGRGSPRFMGLVAGTVSGFLDDLVDRGRIPQNPFAALRARYGRRRREEILATMLDRSPSPLMPVPPPPCFRSPVAPHLEAFVALKRAMGRRYDATLRDLQRFDRFMASQPVAADIVTPELVRAWLAVGRPVSPRTQTKRLGVVRQFCLYLARLHPDTHVPDRTRFPLPRPAFKAYIYSCDEYRALLRAALALPAPRATLGPRTFYTVLLVLFATGLRVGEALRLRLRDLDLDAGTLLVRETKFFKSRVVPFSPTLAEGLRAYRQERLIAATGPDAPLFLNHARRPYSTDKFSEVFRTLLVAAGVPQAPRTPRPRVYDIRHTFAVTRVLRWYREDADVQAKLPLLATYMGHVDVLSTQVYLTSTAELLREASQRFERTFGRLVTLPQEARHARR